MPRIDVYESDIAAFIAGYKTALSGSSSDVHNGEELEHLDGYEFAPVTLEHIGAGCRAFIEQNRFTLLQAVEVPGYSWDMAGHDFWLTRAGHGAGYWDGDLPDDIGNALTAACDAANLADGLGAGNPEPYIGDDGLIYILGKETAGQ